MDTVVYRGGILGQNMLGPISPPHRTQCFSLPSLQTRGFWDKICNGPSPNPPAVFFTPLSASLGVLAQNMLGPVPPQSSPQQCFSLPLCKPEQNMSGPAPPSSDFYSLFCGPGPHPPAGPRPTRPKGSGHANHPRRPGASLTFMQEHRI